ncbi:MAG: MFS transporter, partial [Candidatus Dormibacteraeota bacterium]|nr:MFS transporter [Candidatus Dormibacteraeota bacterium]
MSPEGRRAIIGAILGFVVDFYDIYLPLVALAPAISYFQPKDLPGSTVTTLFYLVFAVTLIGRPIGAIIFGHFADRVGRKQSTMISVAGFAVTTLLIAVLPGYQTLGIASLVLLIVFRLMDGIFLGGEYTSNNTLAMEYCPKHLRGFVGGLIQSAYPIAYVGISLFTAIMLAALPHEGPDSAYAQWGWRVPFVVGALIAFAFLIWYRTVPESRMWKDTKKSSAPLRELLQGQNLRNFLQVFVLMTGFWLQTQAVTSVLPGLLIQTLKLPSATVTNALLVANLVLVGGYLAAALLGQRFGRRRMLIIFGANTLIVGCTLYFFAVRNALAGGSLAGTLALVGLLVLLTTAPWALATTYVNERFPTNIRSSGYGVGYSLAVVIPSFYSFYLLGLAKLMPYAYTQIVLLVLCGLFVVLGA